MSLLLRGIAWNSLATTVNQAGAFVRLFVVAAAIGPHAMGSLAVAASFMAAMAAFTEFGVRQTYIANPQLAGLDDAEFLAAAWAGDAVLKCALLVISLPAAYGASQFIGTSQLPELVFGFAVATALASWTNPALLQREKTGDFRSIAFIEMAAQVVGVGVAVAVAFRTRSAWALVAGSIAVSVVLVGLSYAFCPRPALRFAAPAIRRVIVQGRHFMVIAVTMFVTYSLDKILLGALVSEVAAGRFFLAQKVAEAPGAVLKQAVGRALLPHYAQVYGTGQSSLLWPAVRKTLLWVGAATGALLIGSIAVWALGLNRLIAEDWRDAVPLIPWLVLGVSARLGCYVVAQSLIVRNEVRVDSRLKVQEAVVYLIALPLLVATAGTAGAAAGFVLMYVVALVRRIAAARSPTPVPTAQPRPSQPAGI